MYGFAPVSHISDYHREKMDWAKILKSIDDMFPPSKRKRQDKDNPYPLDDTETKKRVMERYRKRKEKQQQ